jgi:hypothetical protein
MNNVRLIADTTRDIKLYTLLSLKQTLKLECLGLKFRGGSVYAYVKRTYGFKGNKHSVLAQLTDYVKSQY